jgi:chromosome partitioning protein
MKTKVIGFINQKGGVGKTTILALLASYIHENHDENIIAIDLDYPQHSLNERRIADISLLQNDSDDEANLNNLVKDPFPIQTLKIEEIGDMLSEMKKSENYLIFVDLAGTLNQKSYLTLIKDLDCAVIPLSASYLDFQATIPIIEIISKNCPKTKVIIVWNKIKSSESPAVMNAFEKYFSDVFPKIYLMRHKIKDLVYWKNNLSTIFPTLKIKEFATEFYNQIN